MVTEPGPTPVETTIDVPEPDRETWRRRWPPMSYWIRLLLTIAAVSALLMALWSVINIVILVLISLVLRSAWIRRSVGSSGVAGPAAGG